MAGAKWSTLGELVRVRAQAAPERTAYTFLRGVREAEVVWTYGQLERRARAIATTLQARCQPDDRALIQCPPGLDYIAAFFGCVMAGVIAVPVPPAMRMGSRQRLATLTRDASPSALLVTESTGDTGSGTADSPEDDDTRALSALPRIFVDAVDETQAADWRDPNVKAESVAFLQYTSGSTSTPRGVRVTHANLAHNLAMIYERFGHSDETIVMSWLPLHHDMGLIGNVFQPLYGNFPCVFMSPLDFLKRPIRWLQAITRFRVTTSGGPDFAYGACVDRTTPEQRAGLDLSTWTVAYNGAEAVRAATTERFAETFEPHGYRRAAMHPCYGLAESTLYVAGRRKLEGTNVTRFLREELVQGRVALAPTDTAAADVRALVSCGCPGPGMEVVIVDPETEHACGPSDVGEIWLRSESTADGYWQRDMESNAVFRARIGSSNEGPYLRTGDVGFMLEGELYVTGRRKDVLIVDGTNHDANDVEQSIERCSPHLRAGGCAVFAVDDGTAERIVVLAEIGTEAAGSEAALVKAMQGAAAEHHTLPLSAVGFVKPGGLLRTTSGKLQRAAMREAYRTGALSLAWEWRAQQG